MKMEKSVRSFIVIAKKCPTNIFKF